MFDGVCAKKLNVCFLCFRLHHVTSTDCGFCQGNMSRCCKVCGKRYHWISDLYERLQLLVILSIVQRFKKKVEDRMKEIERGKTAHKKQTRIKYITHSACPRNKRSQKLSGCNEILKSFLLLGKTFPHILIYIYLQAEVVLLWVCSKFELSLNTFTTTFFEIFCLLL